MEEKPDPSQAVDKQFLDDMQLCLKQNKFASVLFKADRLDMAETRFIATLQLADSIGLLYTNLCQNLANLYAQKKDYSQALNYYQRVIDESPHNPQNAKHKNVEPQSEAGLILYSEHLNSWEAYEDAHTNMGFTLLGLGKPDQAIPFLKQSLKLDPKNKQANINIGNCLRQVGKREEAVKMVIELIESDMSKSLETEYRIGRLDLDQIEAQKVEPNEQVTIITVKWGTKYNAEYVNKLYRGFKRNTSASFRFVCFTDDAQGLVAEIEPRPLLEDWKGWWGKASIFSSAHGFTGLKFFIDLDMIITGDVDPLFKFGGKFALLRTDELYCETLNKNGYNSSIVLWRGDDFEPIYTVLKQCYASMENYIYR
jgi:tetratricopeptide (TPR) repeat protein